jgi:hypothetical protein
MVPKIVGSLLVAGAAAVAVTAASDASAGWTYQEANVTVNSDGSGYARGTFAGFLHSSDPNAYAAFQLYGPGNYYFFAYLNGKYGSCAVPSSLEPQVNEAMLARAWFQVDWDTSGKCSLIWAEGGSAYSNY